MYGDKARAQGLLVATSASAHPSLAHAQSASVQCSYDTAATAASLHCKMHIIAHIKPPPLPVELPDLPDLDDLGNLSFDGSSLAMPSSARTGTPATVTTGAAAAGHRPLPRQASVAHSLGGLFNSMAAASAPMNQQTGECSVREMGEPAHLLLVRRRCVQCQIEEDPGHLMLVCRCCVRVLCNALPMQRPQLARLRPAICTAAPSNAALDGTQSTPRTMHYTSRCRAGSSPGRRG
jgi:hypothetical protein